MWQINQLIKTYLDWSFPLGVLPSQIGQAEDSQSNRELCAQRSESLQDWRIYLCGQRYICVDREIFVCTEIRKLSNQDVMGNKRVYIWSSQDLPMLQSRRSWSWKICWKSKGSNRTWMPVIKKKRCIEAFIQENWFSKNETERILTTTATDGAGVILVTWKCLY